MGGGGVKGDPQARKSSTSHPDRGAVVEGVKIALYRVRT